MVSEAHAKYAGAAAVNGSLYMAPMNADNVGVLSTATLSFSSMQLGQELAGATRKYSGALAHGDFVYFAPHHAPSVGIVDARRGTFRSVVIGNGAPFKYQGVARSESTGLLYFGPHDQRNIGVFDPTSGAFRTIEVPLLSGVAQYSGVLAVGQHVYCVPFNEARILILDTLSEAVTTIRLRGISALGSAKYHGGVAVPRASTDGGTRLYFAPYNLDNIGVLDVGTSSFSTIRTTGDASSGLAKYAAACGMRAVQARA